MLGDDLDKKTANIDITDKRQLVFAMFCHPSNRLMRDNLKIPGFDKVFSLWIDIEGLKD
jgi:hypothetical protein